MVEGSILMHELGEGRTILGHLFESSLPILECHFFTQSWPCSPEDDMSAQNSAISPSLRPKNGFLESRGSRALPGIRCKMDECASG